MYRAIMADLMLFFYSSTFVPQLGQNFMPLSSFGNANPQAGHFFGSGRLLPQLGQNAMWLAIPHVGQTHASGPEGAGEGCCG